MVAALFAFLVLTSMRAAHAQEQPRRAFTTHDVWSEPNPGVRFLHRATSVPTELYAVVVDLRAPGVRIIATPHATRWQTVSDFARGSGAAIAVNGGFWGAMQRPLGLAAGGGALWPGVSTDPLVGVFGVDARGRVVLAAPGDALAPDSLASLTEAVSGRPLLLRAGAVAQAELDAFETANQRQPRTAVGISADRRSLVLVVVDGRRRTSRGMTLYELARVMIELGAADALNLDGGGSSEMYVARAGGIANVPSRGRLEAAAAELFGGTEEVRALPDGGTARYVRGVEREVLNHLGVIAPEPDAPPIRAHADALAGAPPPELPRARPPSLSLGQQREWLVPLAHGALAGALATLASLLLRRAVARLRARALDQGR